MHLHARITTSYRKAESLWGALLDSVFAVFTNGESVAACAYQDRPFDPQAPWVPVNVPSIWPKLARSIQPHELNNRQESGPRSQRRLRPTQRLSMFPLKSPALIVG